MVFYSLITGFLCGVAVESLFPPGSLFLLVVSFVGALFIGTFWKQSLAYLGVFLLMFVGGASWFILNDTMLDSASAWIKDSASFSGKAQVVGDPILKNGRLRITAKPEGHSAEVLLYAPPYPRPGRGDTIHVSGTWRRVENFTDDFDYVAYLRAKNILYELAFPALESVEPAPWNSFSGALGRVRVAFLDTFRKTLSEPHASLLAGITIGSQEGLEDVDPQFKIAGISHITVLSGYNITVVATAIQSLLIGLGFWVSIWGGVIGVVFFTLMVGLGASSVRAAFMAVLAILARAYGKEYDAGRALLFVVFCMVLLNPRVLIFDVSFQLSVLATIGILYGPDRVAKYCTWLPERFGIKEAGTTTIAAQLFVVPYMLYTFGTLSLVSLPANIAILPLIPVVMFLGSFLGLVGFLSTGLASLLAIPSFFILSYMLRATEIFASIPYAAISFGKGSLLVASLVYAIILYILFPELWKRKV